MGYQETHSRCVALLRRLIKRALLAGQACVVPRPIGWISTSNANGEPNLAPYSQFNNLTFDPPYVMFSANQTVFCSHKDTVVNVEQTGKFCWNLATWDLREAVNITAEQTAYGVEEFERASLTKEGSTIVKNVPMVRESPVKFECVYHSTIRLPGNPPVGSVDIIIGRVVGIHISEDVLTDGLVDIHKTQPIARCGYHGNAVVQETFDMVIPGSGDANSGLEGSTEWNGATAARAVDEKEGNRRQES